MTAEGSRLSKYKVANRVPAMVQESQIQQDERHQSQVASSIGNTVQRQCGLPDVVQEVPHIVNMLHRKSRSALSGCNTQLRHILHSCTTVILMKDQKHLQTLVRGYWPQLAVVVLRQQHFDWSFSWPHRNNLQLIAILNCWQSTSMSSTLDVWQTGIKCSVLLVASKVQQQPASMTCHHSSASAASAYLGSKCMAVGMLDLMLMHNTQGIAQLALINWCSLTCLILSSSKLEALNLTQLMKASLVQLNHLSLSYNHLGSKGTATLLSAHLPRLQYLDLQETQLNALAARHLVAGDWPSLMTLCLSCNLLDDMAMLHIANGYWPMLRKLDLEHNPVSFVGFERLTKGRWPELNYLTISSAMISPATLALLDVHTMPCLPTGRHDSVCIPRDLTSHDPSQTLIWPRLDFLRCFPAPPPSIGGS